MIPDEDYELPVSARAVSSDRLSGLDWILAVGIVFASIALLFFWAFPGIYPDAWDDVVVAAGLRPAAEIAPGIWHISVSGLFRWLGLPLGLTVLKVLGAVAVGICGGMVYLLFRELLSLSSRLRLQYSPQRYLIVRLASVLGSIFFVCADPVWRAGQLFSPVTFLLLLSVFGMYLFFSFLQRGRLASAYGAMFVLGILSAETPMGFVLVAFCWMVYFLAVRHVLSFDMPLLNPFIEQISKWHMTFLFVFGLLLAIASNCMGFAALGGLEAAGMTTGDMAVAYGVRIWHQLTSAASPLGWVLALGVVLLPCGVSAGLLPRAVDEEQFLPYHIGAIFIATGLLAYAQLASLDPLWMWTWISNPPQFHSQYLLCLLMLAASVTVTLGLVVLGVDAFCRNHRRLAQQMFAEMQMEDTEEQMLASKRFLGSVRRFGLVALPVLLLLGVVPGRRLAVPRQMAVILDDYVREVCEECGDVRWLFTDGKFDSVVEVMAACDGRRIRALSLMAGNTPRDVWIRSHEMDDKEDILTAQSGAAATLRTWVRDKPDRLSKVALQMGLAMWKRDGKTPPPCSGVLCRPVGMDESARERGIAAAKAIALRMLDLYRAGGTAKAAGVTINELFLFVQWRLSRMMRANAESADRAGRTEEAMAQVKLADELDRCNSAIQSIRSSMERMRQYMMSKMTPREGLQLALVRADFSLARKYAEPILDAEPTDPNANFGMGMSYFVEGQWARAEDFLRRCLVRNPTEPAVYNNLAIIQLKTGRFDAARRNANKALELVPDSAEVKDTIQQIEKAYRLAVKAGTVSKEDADRKSRTNTDEKPDQHAQPASGTRPDAR